MAKKIAVINIKGGVGKSTLCVNLAWHYSAMKKWLKRVLLIDLDPQFNASQYIVGAQRYQKEIFDKRPTVWDIFEQAARSPGLRASGRQLTDAIFTVVNFVPGNYIHLIPSQLELSYSLKNPSQKEHLLANFVQDIEDNYDLIIIDCAPTESILTTAAYQCADQILIPVKPEYLSTIGLPLIHESTAEFAKLYKKNIGISGVCFNNSSDYAPEAKISKAEVRKLCSGFKWHVFPEEIPFSRSFPKGAREGAPIFRTTYAHTSVAAKVAEFCDAFAKRIAL